MAKPDVLRKYQLKADPKSPQNNPTYAAMVESVDDSVGAILRKLDELMWTFLRLLGIEESLEQFLETERREDVPALLKEAEAEATRLNSEVEALKAKGGDGSLETSEFQS